MQIASVIAEASYANKKKVGAIIVKDLNIIAIGYNGTPKGFSNECEDYISERAPKVKTKPEVLHAESNAIAKCAINTSSSKDSTMYVTLAPCIHCAKLIIQAGISKLVFLEWHKHEGIGLLHKTGMEIIKLDLDAFKNRK